MSNQPTSKNITETVLSTIWKDVALAEKIVKTDTADFDKDPQLSALKKALTAEAKM
jgi:hypothetical protein